jgi:hypothetical protein
MNTSHLVPTTLTARSLAFEAPDGSLDRVMGKRGETQRVPSASDTTEAKSPSRQHPSTGLVILDWIERGVRDRAVLSTMVRDTKALNIQPLQRSVVRVDRHVFPASGSE